MIEAKIGLRVRDYEVRMSPPEAKKSGGASTSHFDTTTVGSLGIRGPPVRAAL